MASMGVHVKDVVVSFAPEHEGKSKEELSKILDEEIERYSRWLTTCPDVRAQGALTLPERAILKTYFIQKTKGLLDQD